MGAFSILRDLLGTSHNNSIPVAFYVAPSSRDRDICQNGIYPCADGHVHLFGKLACAYTKRAILEENGEPHSVWKIDITGLKVEIDPTGEEISSQTPTEQDKFCHGFMLTAAIPAGRVVSNHSYL
jgi:hypothetical protein